VTFDEMELSMKDLRDNQVVQGQLLHRVEMNLDRLEGNINRLEENINRTEGLVEQNTKAIAKLADGFVLLQSAMKGMVQSVEGLSATVDRFIRGMERNGHHPSGGDEPTGAR
jgi:predicted  nucleic acid-binding Zn-ribbon protein